MHAQVRAGDAEHLNMAAPSDFFELLQVSTDATPEDVRAAYRGLQRYCHPDIAGEELCFVLVFLVLLVPLAYFQLCEVRVLIGDEAHELSMLLNRAYKLLSDEDSRKAYAAEVRRSPGCLSMGAWVCQEQARMPACLTALPACNAAIMCLRRQSSPSAGQRLHAVLSVWHS